MEATILGMLAETPIHPGSGRGLGVIDLPVAREAATDYPVIVGSSLKGALKDKAQRGSLPETNRLFGGTDRAGDLILSDARLLLLPVRSLTSAYRWATCPHLVERYRRDARRAGGTPGFDVPRVSPGQALTRGAGHLFLEERQFEIGGTPDEALVRALRGLMAHDSTKQRLADRIAVLHDDDFQWFARYGLSIQARNVLDGETKMSTNLWYEETLPPDTVMYAVVAARSGEALESLGHLFPEGKSYLQVGGNETVGQGWFAVKIHNGQGE